MRQNKTKTRSQRNVPKVAEVNKAVKSGFQPRRLSAGSSQGTPQPSLDCAFPLIQVQLHHSGGVGGPCPTSLLRDVPPPASLSALRATPARPGQDSHQAGVGGPSQSCW